MRLRFLKQTLTKLPKHNESSCENQNDELKYTKRLKLYTEGKYSIELGGYALCLHHMSDRFSHFTQWFDPLLMQKYESEQL